MFDHPQKNHPSPQFPACSSSDKSKWGVLRECKLTLTFFSIKHVYRNNVSVGERRQQMVPRAKG